MPVFGNRMVVGTANYKHVQEFQAEVDDRETKLGNWEQEKQERKEKLRQLNESTKRRMSQRSALSINSDGTRSGPSSRRGSTRTADSDSSPTVPAVTVCSTGERPLSPNQLTVSVPANLLEYTPSPTNHRPSTDTSGDDLTTTDIQEIVGGGRKKNVSAHKSSFTCGNCSIQ